MLSFIPMKDRASVFRQETECNEWGRVEWKHIFTGYCQLIINQDLVTIMEQDGFVSTMATTVVFKGLVDVRAGDRVEYKDVLGQAHNVLIEDVYFATDWGGKIIYTRVVSGKGKRL